MTGFLRVFRFELTRQLGRRGYQFATIGIPILIVAALLIIQALAANDTNAGNGADIAAPRNNNSGINGLNLPGNSPFGQTRPSGYVDLSGLFKSAVVGFIPYRDIPSAAAALQAGEVGSYYVISKDYLETGQIDAYFERFNLGNLSNLPLRLALINALSSQAQSTEEKGLVALLQSRDLGIQSVVSAVPGASGLAGVGGVASAFSEGTAFILVMVFTLMLFFTAFLTSGYLMQSLVEEKENRTVEILLSSVRPRELLFGKFAALSLTGFVQMMLWYAAVIWGLSRIVDLSPALAGFRVTTDQFVGMLLYFVLGYMLFGAAYAVIGAVATNMREGPQFAAFITIPAMVPFWVLSQFVAQPNSGLAVGLSLFPITAPLAMVMRMSVTPVPAWQIILSAGLLLLTVIGLTWLAARLFRVGVLLSGTTPKFRDLVRLVREKA